MSKGPILQGDSAVPLRCVHKTEEQKKCGNSTDLEKSCHLKRTTKKKKNFGELKKEKKWK